MSLTPWDIGQELIKCADQLLDSEKDLRAEGHTKLANMLRECRKTIGDHFNILGSHSFGLLSHDEEESK